MSSPLRFAAIGDSLTQGFQSGAIVNTAWSFPAIIARAAGLSVGSDGRADFRVPAIAGDGLPLNVEAALRVVARETGPKISLREWLSKVPLELRKYVDRMEHFYEQGPGNAPDDFAGVYHNLAIFGQTVFEATEVSSSVAEAIVQRREGLLQDDPFGLPSSAEYRVAQRVLNPARVPQRAHGTQLDNLDWLVNGNRELGIEPEPLDAVLVWLGANDCLETVVTLEVREMPDVDDAFNDVDARRKFNLTSARQFEADFRTLRQRLDRILAGHSTRVFVGTVPDVTIPPITTGIGPIGGDGLFAHYARFTVPPDDAENTSARFRKTLSREQVIAIQRRVTEFNRVVRQAAADSGWFVVDTASALARLAVRRNHADARPETRLREYYADRLDHPLLGLDPVPSLQPLETDENEQRARGGLTSLDFVHPSTVGYGIVAELFLDQIQKAGLAIGARIPWEEVIRADSLVASPPTVWNDVRRQAASLSLFWDLVARVLLRT